MNPWLLGFLWDTDSTPANQPKQVHTHARAQRERERERERDRDRDRDRERQRETDRQTDRQTEYLTIVAVKMHSAVRNTPPPLEMLTPSTLCTAKVLASKVVSHVHRQKSMTVRPVGCTEQRAAAFLFRCPRSRGLWESGFVSTARRRAGLRYSSVTC